MQPQLQLKHINLITTYKCTTHCSIKDYCYTYEQYIPKKDNDIDERTIINIINNICLYPPQSLLITGGNPLLLSINTLNEIIAILKNNNIITNIHINSADLENANLPLQCDTYYISVNSVAELNNFITFCKLQKIDLQHIIVTITVTILNIFELHDILYYIYKNNIRCNIHYMLIPNVPEVAVYGNIQALQYFRSIISQYKNEYITLTINTDHNFCNAGINECTILPNGDVVPCIYSLLLYDNTTYTPEGNILQDTLQTIWETKFRNRYHKFLCCKDIINMYPNYPHTFDHIIHNDNDDDDIAQKFINQFK